MIITKEQAEVFSKAGYTVLRFSPRIYHFYSLTSGRVKTSYCFKLGVSEGKLLVMPAEYMYRGKSSLYTYEQSELRYLKSNHVIRKFVLTMKKAGLWSRVDNKKFFKLNDNYNKSADKDAAKKEYEELIS